jgi:hypothetical protein
LAACSTFNQASAAEYADEAKVKVVYVFNFASFVTWPNNRGGQRGQPFRICALGSNRVSELLPQVINGEQVQGRAMEFGKISDISDAARCQILFLATQDAQVVNTALDALRNLPVLTVGEKVGFAKDGGHIELALNNNRVGIIINRRSVEQSGLRVSAKLYRLARIIDQP